MRVDARFRTGSRRIALAFGAMIAALLAGVPTLVRADAVITTVAGDGVLGNSGNNGPAVSARLTSPVRVAVDAAGNLFILESVDWWQPQLFAPRVRRVDAATQTITELVVGRLQTSCGPTEISWPADLAVDASGALLVVDSECARISRLAPGSAVGTPIAGTGTPGFSGDNGPAVAAQLSNPRGVAIDGAGNLFIADSDNHRVRRVDAVTKAITTIAGTGTAGFNGDGISATTAQLDFPAAVAVDAAGNVFILDRGNQKLRKVSAGPSGLISTVSVVNAQWPDNDLDHQGIAVDAAGNLLVPSLLLGNSVLRVDPATGVFTNIAGGSGAGSGPVGDGGDPLAARLDRPAGVALHPALGLYIADSLNHRIRRVREEPPCSDGRKNHDETGIDCGGGSCQACKDRAPCKIDRDCQSSVCGSDGRCAAASCTDTAKNGNETDLNCGGQTTCCPPDPQGRACFNPELQACLDRQCAACDTGKRCVSGMDCQSHVCRAPKNRPVTAACRLLGRCEGVCSAPSCDDEAKNGNESDVDCGRNCPNQCALGKSCTENADCTSKVCEAGRCADPPNCFDNQRNGTETGTDCGGSCEKKCSLGESCNAGGDCATRVCDGSSKTCACGTSDFVFTIESSAGGSADGASWRGGTATQGANGCSVTIQQPDGRIDLVGGLRRGFEVVGKAGFAQCSGSGGEDGDGCNPVSCPPAGVGSCHLARPSCSSALNGSAAAQYLVQCR